MKLSLDDTVNLLFNSFNNELKAVTVGFLLDDAPKTTAMLLERGRELTGDAATFQPRRTSVIQNYLDRNRHGNLTPFVDIRAGREGGRQGASYALSALGREYGVPISRFLLYQSDIRFNLPLQSWLGLSQQNGPAKAAHLLAYINDNPAATTMEIVRASHITKTAVIAKLRKMAATGLISRRSFAEEGNGRTYALRPQGSPIQGGAYKYPYIYHAVSRVMRRYQKPLSAGDIMSCPDFPYSDMDKLNETLGDMVRKGEVNDSTNWRAGERMSEFRVTARGHDLARWIINQVIGFAAHDKESVEFVRRKEIYPRKLPIAMQLYRSQLK